MPVEKKPHSPTWVAFAIAVVFLTEILLGVYVYRTKSQLQHEIMMEARSDVWRNEIREILNDPKFCALNGCYGSERDDNSKKAHGDIKNFGETNHSQIPLEAVQKLCSTIQENCPRLPAVTRERRNADGLPGPPGLPGPSGPRGHPGPFGEYGRPGWKGDAGHPGRNGMPGQKGERGDQGSPGTTNDATLIGPPGPKGAKGEIGVNGYPGMKGSQGFKGDKGERIMEIEANGDGLGGPAGPPGAKGDKGFPGPRGHHGPTGEKGDRGLPCEKNDTGLMGPPGKCGCSGNGDNNWKVSKYGNQEYPGLPPRNAECILRIHDENKELGSDEHYNSWMADSSPQTDADAKKFWTTDDDNYTLFEFDNEELLLQNNPTKKYELYADFQGNAHVIYKGSLFYQTTQHKKIRVMKYHLNNKTGQVLDIPELTPMNSQRLYNTSDNYLDFNVDENGLWVIFAVPDSTNTAVMKVDIDKMAIQSISNITLNHNNFVELIVVSGVLYGITANNQDNNAWDLYTNKAFRADDFYIDGQEALKPATVAYDYRNKQLLVFRDGKRLSYPVVCNEEEYSKKIGVSAE